MSDARAMLACLANAEVARVFAGIAIHTEAESEISSRHSRRAVGSLVRSGLVARDGEHLALDLTEIKAVLAGLTASRSHHTDDRAIRWGDRAEHHRSIPPLPDSLRRVTRGELRARRPEISCLPRSCAPSVYTGTVTRDADGTVVYTRE